MLFREKKINVFWRTQSHYKTNASEHKEWFSVTSVWREEGEKEKQRLQAAKEQGATWRPLSKQTLELSELKMDQIHFCQMWIK